MTFSAMKTRVLRIAAEDPAAPAWTDAAAAGAALNEAQRIFAFVTLCLEKEGTLALTGGTTFYHLLATFGDFLVPLRVDVVGGTRVLPGTLNELDARDSGWQSTVGAPARYQVLGLDLLAITPRPAGTGTSLTITYAHVPADLAGDSDTPQIPEEYHDALVKYAVNRVRFNEGGPEFLSSLKYLDPFWAAVKKLAAFVRARNKGAQYDREPFEIEKYDISKLGAGKRRIWQKPEGS